MDSGATTGGRSRNSLEEVRERADRAGADGQEMEHLHEVALSRAQDGRLPAESRKQWAKLSLRINTRMHGDGPWDRARMTAHNGRLRTMVIEELGPDPDDADWDPAAVVSDIVSAATLTPPQARDLSVRWQERPIEQIGLLRRAKNVTAPLERLQHHLRPGPLHDLALEWLSVRKHLP
ncbi:hypothetical protein ACFT9I_00115 [Streptomyces sp. NPDC057137]|uniref:hypothetical protein n=1 Tax=Streptomyces sp. NPDC057137 TaxID=3346030 RepID=UPI0036433FE0